MFRSIAILAVVSTATASANTEKIDQCMELFDQKSLESDCCEGMDFLDHMEECKTDSKEAKGEESDWPCAVPECTLGKNNLLSSDNKTVDEEATSKLLDKHGENHSTDVAAVARVKNSCLNGKFKAYAPKPTCDAIKFYVCTYINSILECPKWKGTAECTKLKTLTNDCKSLVSEALAHLAD